MTTVFWTLYLAFTLFVTVYSFRNLIFDLINDVEYSEYAIIPQIILTAVLWAIWYMYYLN